MNTGIFKRFLLVNNQRRSFHYYTKQKLDKIKIGFRTVGKGSVDFQKITRNVGVITLNNPEKKNALSGKMLVELHDLVSELNNERCNFDDVKGVILTGNGNIFSSGGDLKTLHVYCKKSQERGHEMSCLTHDISKTFQELSQLSVALINGRAVAGGAEMALFTDMRAFVEDLGQLEFVHAKMGLLTTGGATRLKQLMGRNRTLDILHTCQNINANHALRLGICDKIIDKNSPDALQETVIWLESMIGHDISVIKSIKQVLTQDEEDRFVNERTLFAPLWAAKL